MDWNQLPIYTSQKLDSFSKDGETFSIVIGLDKSLVTQVKNKSLDKADIELQENTSDLQRFGQGSYEEWYAKERTPYALVDDKGQLAALAWFGPKPLGRKSLRYLSPEELAEEQNQQKTEWHTIVYRSYEPFRGKRLMTPFVRYVMEDYKKRHPEARLWAGISTKNPASVALAAKLGFTIKEEYSDPAAQWCAMVE